MACASCLLDTEEVLELDTQYQSRPPVPATCVDARPPAKRPKPSANACSECGLLDKYKPSKNGHTLAGWCPSKQRYACSSAAAKRLQDWEQHVSKLVGASSSAPSDAADDFCQLAWAFIAAVQRGDDMAAQGHLRSHEELILIKVPAGYQDTPDGKRPHWDWSVLHEAASKLKPQADDTPGALRALRTFCMLLDFCKDDATQQTFRPKEQKNKNIDVNHALPKSSRSRATVMHEVAYRGNMTAMNSLIDAGGDLFARTVSGWWPLHNALKLRAPAHDEDGSFARWLLSKMREHDEAQLSKLATPPKGFKPGHECDMARLAELAS